MFIKDLPIHDIRCELDYKTAVHEPVLVGGKGATVNGVGSRADASGRVTFTVLMSYSEAFQLGSTSHPLQILPKKLNYVSNNGSTPYCYLSKLSDFPSINWNIYNISTPVIEKPEDLDIMKMIKWLWINHSLNYDAWMKIIAAMIVAKRRMRGEPIENDLIMGCVLTKKSVNTLIGRRGLCHGFSNVELPKLRMDPNTGLFNWPSRWALPSDSDDSSLFDPHSPVNSDFETGSDDSGPIGVMRNFPRKSGFTSVTGTSSEEETSKLDIFVDGQSGDYWDRHIRKRFDLYMRSSLSERQNRRAIREARRLVRLKYDMERRKIEPAFNAEAKRAEALAAERVRLEIRFQKDKQNPYFDFEELKLNKKKPLEHYMYRFKYHNHTLKLQLENEWNRYYGEKVLSLDLSQSKDVESLSLNCWLSPVPWIYRDGPK